MYVELREKYNERNKLIKIVSKVIAIDTLKIMVKTKTC